MWQERRIDPIDSGKEEGPEVISDIRAINPGDDLLSRNLSFYYHWRLKA
jgi:hypothetical protein